ncbi:MAG TPA: cellulase family glycosylhydrolase [Acetobacteraceae bacterium]
MLLCTLWHAAVASPPAERLAALRHGINITGWFRFPVSREPARLAAYLSDAAIADLHAAGFTFLRLAVDPALMDSAPLRRILVGAIRRVQRGGLAVVVSPHPAGWKLETRTEDRERLRRFWQEVAPALQPLNAGLTFPEVLNEPVFRDDPTGWRDLQRVILADIRKSLPTSTVILTGNDWGSIGGLATLTPESDPDVVYSFHFYDPPELTSLAAYRPALDRGALSRMPFPARDPATCGVIADRSADSPTRDVMHFYCSLHWDQNRVASVIGQAASWARRGHVALLTGEFGANATLNRSARLAWLSAVRRACERNGIGWALWGYDDVMGFDVPRPPPQEPVLDRDVLRALGLWTGRTEALPTR